MKPSAHVYSVASVRQIDHNAIGDAGIDGYTLMTRAAQASLEYAAQQFPAAKRWLVICGAGNNAGDGYVLARLAANQNLEVSVLAVVDPNRLQGDAAQAFGDFAAAGGIAHAFDGELRQSTDLVVDALLGNGIDRPVSGEFARVIQLINQHTAPTLSLDLPSGLNGDTGKAMGSAVRADCTITFVARKPGLYLGDGPDFCGAHTLAGLDIPDECYLSEAMQMKTLDIDLVKDQLRPRRRGSHKGDFGRVLVVGGAPGMPGAARLAAEAALRSGAGIVSVATHPTQVAAIFSGRPELMCHGVTSSAELEPLLDRATVVAVGPGLGLGEWSKEMFTAALRSHKSLVIDADGLSLLAKTSERNNDWVLTPHPGEAARLLQTEIGDVQSDRLRALSEIRRIYGGTVAMKGAGTLVSSDDGPNWVSIGGNPGMATPGMGDILCGVIAAFRAQGLSREAATVAGVDVHARAGDAAAQAGERGLIASDVLGELRRWVNPA